MELEYREIFDAMPCFVTVQDRSFRIVEANRRFRQHFGDFEGRYCYQVYKRRSERCEVCPVARTFRDGESHESEEGVRTLTGEELAVLVSTMPVRNRTDEIVAVIEMSTDVTHIKRLHALLGRSQRRYQALFDQVPCYISTQDLDLNIIEANRAFQDDFGSVLGRKCYEAYKHRTSPCEPCPVRQTFDDGRSHTREEVVTSLDGSRRHVLVTAAPIRDGSGQVTRVMEMSADITEVRELEDRLTQLGLLIGSVSHSLKGLLNGLGGGLYMVESGLTRGDEARVQKGWSAVRRNADRIKAMVSDILYYAKDRVPNWETLSAGDVAEDVAATMEARARELGVGLEVNADTDAGSFEGDPQAVRALLSNLVENGLDACRLHDSPGDRGVTVRVRGDDDDVLFEVEDDGIGMDRETQEKAFSLFFSSKGTGTGLGLFIADKIAQAHGGDIALDSERGRGTRFVVRLPRVRRGGAAETAPPITKGETIHA